MKPKAGIAKLKIKTKTVNKIKASLCDNKRAIVKSWLHIRISNTYDPMIQYFLK